MAWIGIFLLWVIQLYIFILILRAVFEWIRMFSRGWRPRGVVLVIANICYALTDPPLKALGRVIPPLRLGSIGLDMGFIALFVLLFLAQIFIRIIFF
ncbi:MAG: YggT family protein [Actinomycetaceae bacterium]|nr:YggT family protein [Actinomycetaceae bacterium]